MKAIVAATKEDSVQTCEVGAQIRAMQRYWKGKIIVFVGPRAGRLGEPPYTDHQVTCTMLHVSCAIQ